MTTVHVRQSRLSCRRRQPPGKRSRKQDATGQLEQRPEQHDRDDDGLHYEHDHQAGELLHEIVERVEYLTNRQREPDTDRLQCNFSTLCDGDRPVQGLRGGEADDCPLESVINLLVGSVLYRWQPRTSDRDEDNRHPPGRICPHLSPSHSFSTRALCRQASPLPAD